MARFAFLVIAVLAILQLSLAHTLAKLDSCEAQKMAECNTAAKQELLNQKNSADDDEVKYCKSLEVTSFGDNHAFL